jgi:hypothetical protein
MRLSARQYAIAQRLLEIRSGSARLSHLNAKLSASLYSYATNSSPTSHANRVRDVIFLLDEYGGLA